MRRSYPYFYEARYGLSRPVLEKTVNRFLECGILRHGFTSLKCVAVLTRRSQHSPVNEADPNRYQQDDHRGGHSEILPLLDAQWIQERIVGKAAHEKQDDDDECRPQDHPRERLVEEHRDGLHPSVIAAKEAGEVGFSIAAQPRRCWLPPGRDPCSKWERSGCFLRGSQFHGVLPAW